MTIAPEGLVASTLKLAGTFHTGGVVSVTTFVTVTVKLPLAVLLCESEAKQCTVVIPIGNVEPEVGKHVTGTEPFTRSIAEAVKFTAIPAAPGAFTVIFPGNVRAGGVVSTTVKLKLAVPVLPCVSVAVQLTVVDPSGNVDPEAGEQD